MFFKDLDTGRTKCFDECQAQTQCGPVTVPDEHLFVSTIAAQQVTTSFDLLSLSSNV